MGGYICSCWKLVAKIVHVCRFSDVVTGGNGRLFLSQQVLTLYVLTYTPAICLTDENGNTHTHIQRYTHIHTRTISFKKAMRNEISTATINTSQPNTLCQCHHHQNTTNRHHQAPSAKHPHLPFHLPHTCPAPRVPHSNAAIRIGNPQS